MRSSDWSSDVCSADLGSRELNYSSDVDPMLIYDPALLPLRPREEPGDAAVRIARRVIELMQARDADGYVFRMDLRLRPHPEATPIALPLEAVISYYESRSEERRVGKECVSTCRSRWSRYHYKK